MQLEWFPAPLQRAAGMKVPRTFAAVFHPFLNQHPAGAAAPVRFCSVDGRAGVGCLGGGYLPAG